MIVSFIMYLNILCLSPDVDFQNLCFPGRLKDHLFNFGRQKDCFTFLYMILVFLPFKSEFTVCTDKNNKRIEQIVFSLYRFVESYQISVKKFTADKVLRNINSGDSALILLFPVSLKSIASRARSVCSSLFPSPVPLRFQSNIL